MKDVQRYPWVVMGFMGVIAWAWLWYLPLGVARAATMGAWAPVGGWVTGLTGLGWALCVLALVLGIVKFLFGLTAYREEGLGHGMVSGAIVIVCAVIAFVIIPPLLEFGIAAGATIR